MLVVMASEGTVLRTPARVSINPACAEYDVGGDAAADMSETHVGLICESARTTLSLRHRLATYLSERLHLGPFSRTSVPRTSQHGSALPLSWS